jgi:hypothetical protein
MLRSAWHALRSQGDLGRSRHLFEGAARLAEMLGDMDALGEAAAGVGGLWLHEQRSPVARALARGWRQTALSAIDPQSARAVQLRVREAAESDYASGRHDSVLAAVADARRCGERRVLAEALHLAQHCLLGPEFTELRQSLGDDLLGVAAAIGDPFETSVGLMWRTTNLFLGGHPHADRALTQLRAALDGHPHFALSYVVSAIDVMIAIRAGDFDRAEQLAEISATLGHRAGDLDVVGWYGAHVSTIRFLQGRADELMPMLTELVSSPDLSEPNDAFLGVLAVAASTAGDRWQAASALRRLRRPDLSALRQHRPG